MPLNTLEGAPNQFCITDRWTKQGLGIEVMCHFSARDVLARSCASIGAPSGITIYGVDGSILLEEDVDKI
eukprot:14943994-Ditylum_brightwellii.AAC.1